MEYLHYTDRGWPSFSGMIIGQDQSGFGGRRERFGSVCAMASGGDAPLRVTWSLRPAVGIVVLLSLTPAVRASVSESEFSFKAMVD